MRILVVEDEADLAQAVVDHLRAAAHAVDHASTLDAAQAAVRAMPYALILLDLRLPDGDGLALLRHLDQLVGTGWPVLMALSNKDFVGETLDLPTSERVEGTLAATAADTPGQEDTADALAALAAHGVIDPADAAAPLDRGDGREREWCRVREGRNEGRRTER